MNVPFVLCTLCGNFFSSSSQQLGLSLVFFFFFHLPVTIFKSLKSQTSTERQASWSLDLVKRFAVDLQYFTFALFLDHLLLATKLSFFSILHKLQSTLFHRLRTRKLVNPICFHRTKVCFRDDYRHFSFMIIFKKVVLGLIDVITTFVERASHTKHLVLERMEHDNLLHISCSILRTIFI